MHKSLFLSYSRNDAARIAMIERALSGKCELWRDSHQLAGARFAEEIPLRIVSARVVIVFWSEAAIGSAWVVAEARQALQLNKLVSFSLDGSLPPDAFRISHCENVKDKAPKDIASAILRATRIFKPTEIKFEASYDQYQRLAHGNLRQTIDAAQTARLKALQIEQQSIALEHEAARTRREAERGANGYIVKKFDDHTYLGPIEETILIFERKSGVGTYTFANYDVVCAHQNGAMHGVAIFRVREGERPPDRVVGLISRSGTGRDVSGAGVWEDFTRVRFEGELNDEGPCGPGVCWNSDGSFVFGRFTTTRSNGRAELRRTGDALVVRPDGGSVWI